MVKSLGIRRLHRRCYRTVIILMSLAVVVGLVAAAGPARADQTITSGGPYSVNLPTSGDLVVTQDVPGADPADLTDYFTTVWPESVGLSAGASLSDIVQATWQQDESAQASTPGGFPDPPNLSGGTVTASSDGNGGSTLTIDIPAADLQTTASTITATIVSAVVGITVGAFAWAGCQAAVIRMAAVGLTTAGPTGGLVLSGLGESLCSGLGNAIWAFVTGIVYNAMTGGSWSPEFWKTTLAASLASFIAGAAWAYAPSALRAVRIVYGGLSNRIQSAISWVRVLMPNSWQDFANAVLRFARRGTAQLENDLIPFLDLELGGDGAFIDEGFFENFELGAVSGSQTGSPAAGLCMDAYGTTDGASPAQPVAVNSCNNGSSQLFDYFSHGYISVWGLCLDTGGGTSSSGTQLVDLEPCDGGSSQQWTQVGSTIVNKATSDCLDDPGGSTTAGTQMDVAPCDGSVAQDWLSPSAEPCDIYATYGTACAAAYSTTRAMYAAYDGPLYQVQRASDGTTANIGLLSAGGDVNASEQDSFCANTTCTITEIYDQSPDGNNLTIEQGGGAAPAADRGANASALSITVGGHEAYGVDFTGQVGYRDNTTQGIATAGQPEGMYMVASGTNVNNQCCFDFGNAEANSHDNGNGHMDAVNFSTTCYFGPCTGGGPWVEADMENGLFQGGEGSNTANTGLVGDDFVTAMLKNDGQSTYSLRGGNAQSGGLTTWYDGSLPTTLPGYKPMQQEGGIVLGTGGDNSNWDVGSFFEGVMTSGYPSDAADAAVQANIVAAKYAGNSGGTGSDVTPSAAGAAVVHTAGATGGTSSGYSSVFTVDSANGHLQETYLPEMGENWDTQDLSRTSPDMAGTPPVMAGTKPVALVHCGYTSVYTVDADSGDLQETYLPAIGDSWVTQDLSKKYGTPPTNQTPTAVEHSAGVAGASPGCGFTSVYTVDRNGDLQETYLSNTGFPGDAWATQDLTVNYKTPQVEPGTSPVSLVHCGYTSVYTVDASDHDLQETFLPAVGDGWTTQDLSARYGTPPTNQTPTAVMHSAGAADATPSCGFTSVYTVDAGSQDLQETYLSNTGFPGDAWVTQDLSAKYGTPPVAPGTAPAALVHMNYTSVYTVDQGSDHLEETFLPSIGDNWTAQDLSAEYHTPATTQTPIVLLHPDASGNLDWTSVYTINETGNDLQETYLPATGFPGDPWVTQDLSAKFGTPAVAETGSSLQAGSSVVHDGYTSVYTVDSSGNLWETYLTAMGQPWKSQNLSQEYHTPTVEAGTQPVAVVHDGWTSVYTIDAGDQETSKGDLQETYLSAIGADWVTQDLAQKYDTPTVAANTSPSAVYHDGYTSVYTIDAGDQNTSEGDLQETYLSAIGANWVTQDLSAKYDTPTVAPNSSPAAIVHNGFTSVYTIDYSHTLAITGDLQETYLPAIGDPWTTQDLGKKYMTPTVAPDTSPSAVYHDGYTSVYTVDAGGEDTSVGYEDTALGDLQETYLPAISDNWTTQDLTSQAKIPQVATGTSPVALFHDGYTSVYTIDNGSTETDPVTGTIQLTPGSYDLQETYLPGAGFPGDSWVTQDLTANYGAPQVDPGQPFTALVHPDSSGNLTWTSVFSAGLNNDDLYETYLPAIGDNWTTQDLSAKDGTPSE